MNQNRSPRAESCRASRSCRKQPPSRPLARIPSARTVSLGAALLSALAVSAGPLADRASAQAGKATASGKKDPKAGGAPAAAVPIPRRPVVPAGPPGLDSLSDEQVMSELSSLKLDSLLNHMFEAGHVPKEQQESVRSLGALRELAGNTPIGNTRRILLLSRAVEGVTSLLPKLRDPITLMNYAGTLVVKGIEPDINTLEFWGDNPSLQARVKPATDIAVKMLDQVSTDAEAQEHDIENSLKGPSDPRADLYMKMDQLKDQAKYYKNMIAYYQAMAIDTSGGANKAAVDQRAKICKAAIEYLKDFDAPGAEAGGVQPIAHNRIGKLNMAMGDYAGAKTFFDAMAAGKTPDGKAIDPKPNEGQQYEARYFSVLCDVLNKKPDAAEKGLAELTAWQKTALPPAAQSGVEAAAAMLRYRTYSTKADLAKDAKEKEDLNKKADAVLTALGEAHPEFKAIITEQLVNRLPETAKLTDQGVPVLQALISKGMAERLKPENVPLDEKVMNRAVEAARLLAGRPEEAGFSAQAKQETTLVIPVLLDRQHKDVDAADAYLDFAGKYPANHDAGAALDRAVTLAFNVAHGDHRDETAVKKLYPRALAAAVAPPWSRKELAYYYAEYLRTNGRPREAIAFYKLVPKGDKMEFSARFFELAALNDALDDPKIPPAERAKNLADATALVDEVRTLAANAPQNETTKVRVALTTLMGAELADKQKQGPRALQLLQNFDQLAQGAGKVGPGLMERATFLRAQAYIANNQLDKATEQVVELAKNSPDAARDLATNLLQQLDKDYKRQEAGNQKQEMGETALNMSKLTNFMVQFCQNSKDEKLKKVLPDYQIYDAMIKRRAGTLLADPAAKKQALAEALAAYDKLKQAKPGDANVLYGIALTQFEQQDWAGASATLGTLLKDGKLGGPQITEVDKTTNEAKLRNNETYWEATYKWIKSNAELAKSDPNSTRMKDALASATGTVKNLYTQFGPATGGDEWAGQFAELKKELAPDFDPNALPRTPASGPSTSPAAPSGPPGSPATQPVAARAAK